MITISNSSFDAQSFLRDYGNHQLQPSMLATLERDSSTINFDSQELLKFELDLRAAMVDSAILLHQSRLDFAVFRKSFCNERYWKRLKNGGFQLLPHVKPSAAILDIYQNGHLYGTECSTAMVIVLYRALLMVFHEAAFNRIFKNIYLMNWHSLDRKIAEFGSLENTSYYLPGDRRYFTNPDVAPEKPEWQGENTIQLPNDKHYAHGMGIATTSQIIQALNKLRKRGATKSAYLREAVGRPNYRELFYLKQSH
jgi:protein-glutamine gamma-glutamyltransferase